MTEFILFKTDSIPEMYDYIGYLSPEGIFYKERKVNKPAEIESDLFAWSLLKKVKLDKVESNKNALQKLKQELKEAFGKAEKILVNDYGFIRISDERGYISFDGISNSLSATQEYILKFLSEYYNQKENNVTKSKKR